MAATAAGGQDLGTHTSPDLNPTKEAASSLDAEKGGVDADDKDAVQEFPEGGARAWATASGTALIMFCTVGYVNSWGCAHPLLHHSLLPYP